MITDIEGLSLPLLPTPDYQEANDFLKRFHRKGQWVLTAISPNTEPLETKTFSANCEDEGYRH